MRKSPICSRGGARLVGALVAYLADLSAVLAVQDASGLRLRAFPHPNLRILALLFARGSRDARPPLPMALLESDSFGPDGCCRMGTDGRAVRPPQLAASFPITGHSNATPSGANSLNHAFAES